MPLFERGQVHERLERGAGLALGLEGAIELALGVGASADQHAHAALHVEHVRGRPGWHRRVRPSLAIRSCTMRLGAALQTGRRWSSRRSARGLRGRPATADAPARHRPRTRRPTRSRWCRLSAKRIGKRAACSSSSTVRKPASTILPSTLRARARAMAGLEAGENFDGALSRPASMAASASVSVAGRLAEEALRGRLDAVGAAAEVDAIEIDLEDVALAQAHLQPQAPASAPRACGRSCARGSGTGSWPAAGSASSRPGRSGPTRRLASAARASPTGSTPQCS